MLRPTLSFHRSMLITAGNCGRDFNRSKMNPVGVSIMRILDINRNALAHIYENPDSEKEAYNALMRAQADLPEILRRLKDEAAISNLEYNIEAYFNSRESLLEDDDSSPRPYEAERLNLIEGRKL